MSVQQGAFPELSPLFFEDQHMAIQAAKTAIDALHAPLAIKSASIVGGTFDRTLFLPGARASVGSNDGFVGTCSLDDSEGIILGADEGHPLGFRFTGPNSFFPTAEKDETWTLRTLGLVERWGVEDGV